MNQSAAYRENGVARAAAPLYLLLFPVPVVCFLAALFADLRYESSAYLMWLNFSEWLIAGGLVVGAVAALLLLIEFIASRSIRSGVGWLHLVLFYAALVAELFNALVHTIDGWTAVVWTGLVLSAMGALLGVVAAVVLLAVPVRPVPNREAAR